MSFFSDCQKKVSELQKRVTETGKNVISRTQKWRRMSAVITTDCEVVLTFCNSASAGNIQWFVTLLKDRVPELVVHQRYHPVSGQSALYLTACYRDLLMGAEELGIKKPLLAEHGGGLREFSMDELDLFDNATDESGFLSSSERSGIVYHYLMGLRARKTDTFNHVNFTEGEPMVRPLQSAGLIHQIFPVHKMDELKRFDKEWVRGWTIQQPLDDIRRYFGVQIALYFAWIGHYTLALVVPSVVGLAAWLLVATQGSISYYLFMSVFTLLWSSVYLEHWKRTSSVLTYHWGTWDAPPPLLEEPRSAFRGKLAPCPITGRLTRTYPEWRRKLIICCFTGPIVVLSLSGIVFITYLFVRLEERVDAYTSELTPLDKNGTGISVDEYFSWRFMLLTYTPKVLLALFIAVMDVCYKELAIWLTNFENHRLDVDYHNHLVGKLVLLHFMNSFYSLFYTAFYLRDIEMLHQQLTAFLITRQILGTVKEVFLPYGQSRLRQFVLSFRYERQRHSSASLSLSAKQSLSDSSSFPSGHPSETDRVRQRELGQPVLEKLAAAVMDESPIVAAEREATLVRYDGPDDDYLEMFIQFGYVSMFSCVFPVAGLLALLNNLVEIRGDAFKLVTSFQRPFAQSVSNIGIWQLAMTLQGYAAVIVNIALFGVTATASDLFPGLSTTQLIICLVVIEHCFFIARYALSALISDAPVSVVQQIAKLEHRRREALRTLERETMREHQRHRSDSRSSKPGSPKPGN
ncbi:unnamed protein product [Calicophoron daubneyi]|uniref:Anoctamin n=1 Tax=Calicophoron daubneyi TaxID=300641 RepID=A0AAV2T1W4_CALDB